ncbi:MAG: hypothetical protein AAGC56_03960 [Pseudomonadota bacterium]
MRLTIAAALAAAAVAGCDALTPDDAADGAATDAPPASEAGEAADGQPGAQPGAPAVVDAAIVQAQIGGFEGAISGAAFWSHPGVPFNGLVVAVDAGGIKAFNVEDGAPVSAVDEPGLDGVAVGYLGVGAPAAGYAVSRRPATGDFAVFAIDNATRALTARASSIGAGGPVDAFCLGRDGAPDAGLALHAFGDGTLTTYGLAEGSDGLAATATFTRPAPAGVVSCAVDDADGGIFALDGTGAVVRFDASGEAAEPFATTPAARPSGLAVALNGLVPGGDTGQCCGQVLVLDGADGVLHVYDRETGAAVGAARIDPSFDVAAVEAASGLGVGYGNYGGALRDGAVAHVTTDDDGAPALKLTPYAGVLNAIDLAYGAPAKPRGTPADDDAEEGFAIDLPAIEP